MLIGVLIPCAFSAPAMAEVADRPAAAAALDVYRTIDGWVRAWAVPDEPQKIDPPGASGASVTLRLSGRVLGRAEVLSNSGDACWRAARSAWIEAEEAMPLERDATRSERRAELLPGVMIELQFSGTLTPLPLGEQTVTTAEMSPAVEGLGLIIGDRSEVVFPGTMISGSLDPSTALAVLTAKMGLPPRPLPELMRAQPMQFVRFPVRHLAQPAPRSPPVFLHRGGIVIPTSAVSGASLRRAASAMASHLLTHAWPGTEPHGMTGDYQPVTDVYDPIIAPPASQALAALALARYASLSGIDADAANRARLFAAALVEQFAVVSKHETDPIGDPAALSLWFVAIEELGHSPRGRAAPEFEPFMNAARASLGATLAADGSLKPEVSAAVRAVVALGLSASAGDDPEERRRATGAVRACFRESDHGRLVTDMPWLFWAERRSTTSSDPLPSAGALADLREIIHRFVVTEADTAVPGPLASPDMLGGIVFGRGSSPMPSWHTFRPAVFLADMLADPRLTPTEQVVAELARLRPILRFAMQLMIDDPMTSFCRAPDRARGGVRRALWDLTASVDATSLGLLALTQTLHAMEARADAATPQTPQ